ncbi:MAG: energy transducer TonB [Undibacterium sp.]|uniref:energy transducer TonB n=1 Tax=Undibacterium sp. TaxID=1914977 RepID=UPI002716088A|nr:energy transducer TonB [Undibacterium sp.]MDO8652779.1 energy transducer TonB [Undibacterium sp.]
MNKLFLSIPEQDGASRSGAALASALKTVLVIGAHGVFLAWALHASGMIRHSPAPATLMTVMTLTMASPSPVAPAAQLPKARAPAQAVPAVQTVQRPAVAMPSLPAASTKMATAVEAPLAPVTTPQVTAPVAGPDLRAELRAELRSEASFDAAYLNNPAPAYPLTSRRQGESGKVLLLVQVTPHGTAAQVEIKQSCGFPRLDEAALEAVRKWRFVPARLGEVAIAASVVVPLNFKLNS